MVWKPSILYWRADARIKSAAAQVNQAKGRFHNEYNEWLVKGQASPALRPVLHALDLLRSKRELAEDEYSRAFRRWIAEGGFEFEDQEASLDGARLRRDALLSSLTRLCQDKPLLMVFDTCEVLSADADEALRSLLVEVCDRRKPVLVMMASRLAPDVGAVSGSKDTWRDSLGDDRLKIERFDDLTLTTTEIEQYLRRRQFDPPLDAPEQLAQELHRITLGVPLALRVLVEMEGGLAFLRHELTTWKEEDSVTASRENALYELYEKLAARFLIHVRDEKDLDSILSLAIATDANRDLLVAYWGGRTSWSERVRNLARRFSLLIGGDLHPIVRGHLRRSLRAGKYRQNTKEIAEALAEIAANTPETPAFDDWYFQQKIGIINLKTWTAADPSALDIAPGMALAMAYEQRLDSWISLAAELAEAKQHPPECSFLLELQHLISVEGRSLSYRDFLPRHHWMTGLSAAHREKYFEWLGIAERSREWSKEEKTALHILRALYARDAPDALPRFVAALEHPASVAIPLQSQVGEALFESARRAWLQDRGSADVATSLKLALQVNYQSGSAHAALGQHFLVKSWYDDARTHYAAACELERNNPSYLVNLANLFRLQRAFVDAVGSVDKTFAIDAGYPWAHNQRGLIARDQKQYDGAIVAFEKAHELDPREPVFPTNLADCYRQQKQYGKASEWVDKTLAVQSDYAWAHDQRGRIARDQKQYDGAIAAFEKAHELDPREPVFPNNLADCYRQQKQYGKASEWVDKTLAVQSDYAWAHNQRGLIARDQKQYDGAIAALEKAHELDPREPVFPNNLADCYRQQKQYGKASEWVDKTLAVQSDYAWAHNQRGLIARDQKQYDGAIAAFEKAHELDPREPVFAHNLADCYRQQKQYGKASEWVDKTLAIQSDYASAHNLRGLIAQDQKQYDGAIAAFEKAHELDPRELVFPNNLADCYRQQMQYGKASEWVDKTLAIQSDYAWAHNQRGLIARDQKQYDGAIAALEKAHELDPREPVLPNNLADCYRQQKQYGKASEWVDKTLAIQFDYAWAHNQRGLIARDQKQYDGAIAAFEKAHELDPHEPVFPNSLTDCYRQQKQYGKASEWVDKTLAIQSDYASAHNQRGLIAQDQKQYDGAIAAFEKAHELDPRELVFPNNLADCYRQQMQYGKASEWVDKTLAIQSDYAWAHNRRGLIARDQKQYDGAIAAFEKAHELDPKEAEFAYNLADCYRQQMQYGKAREWVDKTLAIQSDYASAHDQRGRIAHDQKQYDGAIVAFEKAHELDPHEPVFAHNLADCYRQQKQYGKASEWVDKTLAVQSDYAWAHNQRGLIARDQKQYDGAIVAFEKAHELDPHEPVFANNLADCYRQQMQYGKASEWVDKTFAIDAGYPWAHNQRGLIARDQKQYDGAIAAFEKAHELDPREPVFPNSLADCYRQQKQYGKASEWVDKTLAVQSDYAWAHDQRGRIARDQKQYDGAIAAFEKAHELDPREPVFPNNLADCYRQQKQYGKASEWVDKTLAIQSDYAWAHNQRGLIARDQKQYDGAIAALEKAHELDPKEAEFAYNLADCYRQQMQYGKASEWVDKTLAIQSDYAWAHNQRGLIARDQKQYDGAIAALEKAHELDPKEAEFAYNLADCYRQQMQYGKASEWVDKTLAIQSDYASAHNLRGLIAQDQKQYNGAIAGVREGA